MYTIIYEDANLLVVNKEAGVSVHADDHQTEGTLIQEIQKTYPAAELAHRLDKNTSGLLMIAKNNAAYEYVKRLFKERRILKTYTALVSGIVSNNEGVISLPIARSKKDFRKRIATPHAVEGARPAETRFTVLDRFPQLGYTLIEAHPKTGRMHQIRSHLASIGHPVACDKLYGGKRHKCPIGLGRQFLHASALEFTAPDGKHLRFEADLPQDLAQALEIVRIASASERAV